MHTDIHTCRQNTNTHLKKINKTNITVLFTYAGKYKDPHKSLESCSAEPAAELPRRAALVGVVWKCSSLARGFFLETIITKMS